MKWPGQSLPRPGASQSLHPGHPKLRDRDHAGGFWSDRGPAAV